MKKSLILLLTLGISLGFSQTLRFMVRGAYTYGVNSEALREVRSLKQIIPYHTGKGIMSYVSTEVKASCNGNEMIAKGKGDSLTAEQRYVLSQAEPGTDVLVNIHYKYNQKVVQDNSTYTLQHAITILPEVGASFTNVSEMQQYLKENTVDKLCDPTCKTFAIATVRFTINEEGEVISVRIDETSADPKVDEVILEAIKHMPKWKPAQNAKGKKVKQEFEFAIGTDVKVGC